MMLTMRLSVLLSLASVASFAGSWSGVLVDAGCYASAQSNVSHGHPASTDTKRTIRSCSPNGKTSSFSLVEHGTAVKLDSNGNDKAREFIAKGGHHKPPYKVSVTGEMGPDAVKVDTISSSH
jgi:hypothetical protein